MKLIGRIFQVTYLDHDSFVEGELMADKTKTKDFKVFTRAVEFGKKAAELAGASQIAEINIYTPCGTRKESGNRWEVTQDEHYLL